MEPSHNQAGGLLQWDSSESDKMPSKQIEEVSFKG